MLITSLGVGGGEAYCLPPPVYFIDDYMWKLLNSWQEKIDKISITILKDLSPCPPFHQLLSSCSFLLVLCIVEVGELSQIRHDFLFSFSAKADWTGSSFKGKVKHWTPIYF